MGSLSAFKPLRFRAASLCRLLPTLQKVEKAVFVARWSICLDVCFWLFVLILYDFTTSQWLYCWKLLSIVYHHPPNNLYSGYLKINFWTPMLTSPAIYPLLSDSPTLWTRPKTRPDVLACFPGSLAAQATIPCWLQPAVKPSPLHVRCLQWLLFFWHWRMTYLTPQTDWVHALWQTVQDSR